MNEILQIFYFSKLYLLSLFCNRTPIDWTNLLIPIVHILSCLKCCFILFKVYNINIELFLFLLVIDVAVGKAPMQSSLSGNGIPQKAIDGSTSTFFNPDTCSMTQTERSPWWYVNLLEPYMVQLVRLDFGTACCCKCALN